MIDDNDWFDAFYEENYRSLVSFATASLGDASRAEDLVQDTFSIFLRRAPHKNGHPNLSGWLRVTLHFLISDELKSARHRRERLMPEVEIGGKEDTYPLPVSDILPKSLRARDREILILKYEHDLDDTKLAEILKLSPSACRTRLHRARQRCAKALKKEFPKKETKSVTIKNVTSIYKEGGAKGV